MKHLVMDTLISRVQDKVPVAILRPHGNLDRLTYLGLIDRSKEVYDSGQRFLILDLSDINNIGLSGLYALHSIAMLFRGDEPLDPEGGWAAMRWMANHLDDAPLCIRLLKPQPHVRRALSTSGLPIYDNLAEAMASF